MTPLLAWLHDPSPERGIRFAGADGQWSRWPYSRLAELVRGTARAQIEVGVRPGDVVAIAQETGPEFVGLLFGTLLAGATASPVAPPPSFGDKERYGEHVIGLLTATSPRLVVYSAGQTGVVGALAEAVGVPAIATEQLMAMDPDPASDPARPPADLALVQFTSGTSGRVRGVRVPYPALEANIHAIQRWLEMTPDDATASWLPVHHDMGLVGCLLAPVVTGSDLWLMSPADFVRRPLRYLQCFGEHGARLTAMPAFGLDHIVRRVPAQALAGMDFSAWRAVIVGAERVAPSSLTRFTELLAPSGLSAQALLPAYGLAESTLAVTGLPLRTGWSAIDRGDGPAIVGCGPPLTGATVTVVDDHGRSLPDGTTGEIIVGGASVAAGYAQATEPDSPTGLNEGRVRTGDAGFLRDGQLFVVGRLGDSIKVRGRTVFAEDIDTATLSGCDAPAGRIATLLGLVSGRAHVVLLLEHPKPQWVEAATTAAKMLAEEADVVVIRVPVGTIARTSSGKPRRRQLWRAYVAGDLSADPGTKPVGNPRQHRILL